AHTNGTIFVAGWFEQIDGVPRHWLARLLPNGRLDRSFAPAANALKDFGLPPRVTALRDGRCLIWTYDRIAVFRADGTSDWSLNELLAGQPLALYQVIEQPGGRLLCLVDETIDGF